MTFSFLLTREAPASDTPATKVIVGLRGLRGLLVLLDLQQKWSDSGTALWCSRCLDQLDRRDHQGQRGPSDLQELMESL